MNQKGKKPEKPVKRVISFNPLVYQRTNQYAEKQKISFYKAVNLLQAQKLRRIFLNGNLKGCLNCRKPLRTGKNFL